MMVRGLGRPAAIAALLVALLVGSATWTLAAPRTQEYVLPGDAVFPEGIAGDNASGYFYVSSTTDGTIYRGHVSDSEAGVFLPGGEDGRTTAIGLELDDDGRLFIAGGGTGGIWVYDTATGDLLASLSIDDGGFLNDQAATPDGSVYFTNSQVPIIYRVFQDAAGVYQVEEWLNLDGTAIEYVPMQFNLNGILASQDGRYLITVQSNTGELFRIDTGTQEVTQIDLGGASVSAGDGLVLQGRTLYVVRNSLGEVAVFQLNGDFTSGTLVTSFTDATFGFPTTADIVRGRLLVVNSQFNNRGGTPELPFTVSSVPLS